MSKKQNYTGKTELVANWETLQRIFIRPENDAARSTLVKYMEQILFGLHDFLMENVGITEEASLKGLSDRFKNSRITRNPSKKLRMSSESSLRISRPMPSMWPRLILSDT